MSDIVFFLLKNFLHLLSNDYYLSIVEKGGADNATKTKRLSKDEIKEQLLNSSIVSEKVETKDLNEQSKK